MSTTKTQITLKRALELHQQGEINGAETHYRQVLAEDPNNYIALANVATIYLMQGQWQNAEHSLKWASLMDDSNPELAYKLGVSLQQQGKLDEAEKAYQKALSRHSDYPEAYSNLGIIYHQQGKLMEAVSAYEKALQLSPNYADTYCNLGLVLKDQGQSDKAIVAYQHAITLQPTHSNAYYNLGLILQEKNCVSDAIEAYQTVIKIQPNHPHAIYSLGLAYHQQGIIEQAIKCYQTAIQMNSTSSNNAKAYSNLGVALKSLGFLKEALSAYQQSLALNPNSPDVYYNQGLALHQLGQFEDAIQAFQKAITLKFDFPDAHFSLAISLLQIQNFILGWEEYEWRFKVHPEAYPIPGNLYWNGEETNTIELVLFEEQGIGDIFQFIRYGQLLKKSFEVVSLVVRKELIELIESTHIFDHIYPSPMLMPSPESDGQNKKWLPILSLPKILGISITAPLVNSSYISVDPERVEHWSDKLRQSKALMVGLNWQGNPNRERNEFQGRSFQLSEYEPLASVPGIQFVSLQKGYGSEQWASCSFKEHFVACQEDINATWDWVETAAIVQSCDLIITSDTSIAHLAGAMDKPVWILLKKIPEWRWGLEGETCPWYPSARLFRQTEDGNWTEVMERVKAALTDKVLT